VLAGEWRLAGLGLESGLAALTGSENGWCWAGLAGGVRLGNQAQKKGSLAAPPSGFWLTPEVP